MSAGIIIAIGISIATALGIALFAAQRAGGGFDPEGEPGPDERYGHELDARPGARGRRRTRPGVRQRAILALVAAALAALGAALATGLSQGTH